MHGRSLIRNGRCARPKNFVSPKTFLYCKKSIAPFEKSRVQDARLKNRRPLQRQNLRQCEGLNHRHWKNVNQPTQINDQRQAVVVAQHAAAVRDVGGRLI